MCFWWDCQIFFDGMDLSRWDIFSIVDDEDFRRSVIVDHRQHRALLSALLRISNNISPLGHIRVVLRAAQRKTLHFMDGASLYLW
jgi:hypothetical protein